MTDSIGRLGRVHAKHASRVIALVRLIAGVVVRLRAQDRTTAAGFTVVFHPVLIRTLPMVDATDAFKNDGSAITTVRPRRHLYLFPTMEVFAF